MKVRKKPVVVEAMQLTMDNAEGVKEWCGGKTWSRPPMRAVTGISIPTLEGEMAAEYGSWIIKGVEGEFYPCKPDIFERTYEKVGDSIKHKLTLETPAGDRSGCAFTVKMKESEAEGFSPFLLELERALAALYRHEHEKIVGGPVDKDHWSNFK
jgi:hypothetical protein